MTSSVEGLMDTGMDVSIDVHMIAAMNTFMCLSMGEARVVHGHGMSTALSMGAWY